MQVPKINWCIKNNGNGVSGCTHAFKFEHTARAKRW